MARSFGYIDAGIWDDPDFCMLSAGAQRTYFMLITQRDITACGSLALTLRRWAKTCSEKDLEVWLAELSDARFVLIDEDSEELLVRTFVKWDGGHKHAKRLLAVIATAKAIGSPLLRAAAVEELAKLNVSIATPEPPDSDRNAIPDPSGSRRVVVKEGDQRSNPQPSTREKEPSPSEDVEPSLGCVKHPNGTDQPCGPCGSARQRHAAWAKRQERRAAEELANLAAARRACDMCDDLGMRTDPTTNLPAGRCDHRKAAS